MTYPGPGLKVGEVLAGGPFGHADSSMKPGAVITAINGTEIGSKTDPTVMLNSLGRPQDPRGLHPPPPAKRPKKWCSRSEPR